MHEPQAEPVLLVTAAGAARDGGTAAGGEGDEKAARGAVGCGQGDVSGSGKGEASNESRDHRMHGGPSVEEGGWGGNTAATTPYRAAGIRAHAGAHTTPPGHEPTNRPRVAGM